MAIEIIQKPKPKIPLWAKILLGSAVALLLIAAGTYFFLDYTSKKTSQKISDTQAEVSSLMAANRETENKVLTYEKKIGDFASLVVGHQKPLSILLFLEQKTHPRVSFTSFAFDAAKTSVAVDGQAASFIALGQQMLIFKKEPILKNITLSGLSLNEKGEIKFSLQLVFDPQIVK